MAGLAAMVILLMGVSGVGKTTVGQLLAAELGWTFLDADVLHTPANVAKMHGGIPLDDEDRLPWLAAIRDRLREYDREGTNAVLACSALKQAYRDCLTEGSGDVRVVELEAPPAVIRARLAHRQGHFMDPALLDSQFQTLEPPEGGIVVDASRTPAEIVAAIRAALGV